jgi:4-amino-4-deoxy-L-arabinose transferase-like glycosyltransferase
VPAGFINGTALVTDYTGPTVPTAFHPPLFPALLAVGSKLGLTSYGAHRAIGCAIGASTIPVVGLIGRRLGGRALGLAAAALCAVYLPLIANDSVLMSESLYGLTIAAAILAALRLADDPSWRRAAVLGAVIGLSALTRAESLLLLVLLVPFAVRRAGARPLRNALVVVAATVVVVAPWCIRNTSTFDRPTGVSLSDGSVLAGANEHRTYYGPRIGTWDFYGLALPLRVSGGEFNEAEISSRQRDKGLRYLRDHAGRLPLVAAARILRTWSIYPFDPVAKVRYTALSLQRRKKVEWPTFLMAWAVMALAVAGALDLRRRGAWLAPLLAQLVMVTIVSAAFYGDVRFREAADVSLVVLGAAGLLALAGRWRGRRSPATPGD